MMTTKEAAAKWKVSDRTVRDWCTEGLIEGAKQDADSKIWSIPEKALSPHKFGHRQFKHLEQRLVLILEAMSLRKTISPIQFKYDREDMLEEFSTLFNAKLIEVKEILPDKSEGIKDLFRYYKLSMAGIAFRNEHKTFPKIIKAITPLSTAAAEAVIKASLPVGK